METTRRGFLGAAAALAAMATIPGTAKALPLGDRDELERLLSRGGVTIDGREFHIYDGKPVNLNGLNNVTIMRCKFVWHGKEPDHFMDFRGNCHDIDVIGCTFDADTHVSPKSFAGLGEWYRSENVARV